MNTCQFTTEHDPDYQCDHEVFEDDKCIFHCKKSQNNNVKLFWQKIRKMKILENDYDFSYYNFPGFESEQIQHIKIGPNKGFIAKEDFNFFHKGDKLILPEALFEHATFSDEILFKNIIFDGFISFEFANGPEYTSFLNCTFNKESIFKSIDSYNFRVQDCIFKGKFTLSKASVFSLIITNSSFHSDTDFSNLDTGNTNMINVSFEKECKHNFCSLQFSGEGYFSFQKCTFSHNTIFDNSKVIEFEFIDTDISQLDFSNIGLADRAEKVFDKDTIIADPYLDIYRDKWSPFNLLVNDYKGETEHYDCSEPPVPITYSTDEKNSMEKHTIKKYKSLEQTCILLYEKFKNDGLISNAIKIAGTRVFIGGIANSYTRYSQERMIKENESGQEVRLKVLNMEMDKELALLQKWWENIIEPEKQEQINLVKKEKQGISNTNNAKTSNYSFNDIDLYCSPDETRVSYFMCDGEIFRPPSDTKKFRRPDHIILIRIFKLKGIVFLKLDIEEILIEHSIDKIDPSTGELIEIDKSKEVWRSLSRIKNAFPFLNIKTKRSEGYYLG